MPQNARKMGVLFRKRMEALAAKCPFIRQVRGMGLMNALEIADEDGTLSNRFCTLLLRRGLLAKTTHKNIIRMAPPLVISGEQMEEAITIIEKSASEV